MMTGPLDVPIARVHCSRIVAVAKLAGGSSTTGSDLGIASFTSGLASRKGVVSSNSRPTGGLGLEMPLFFGLLLMLRDPLLQVKVEEWCLFWRRES
jgi:hypothetical protein